MNDIFDIYNIALLIIAVLVFLKLRSVLGQRTGNEQTPYDRFSMQQQEKNEAQKQEQAKTTGDNVIQLPGTEEAQAPVNIDDIKERCKTAIDKVAQRDSTISNQLHELLEVEPQFHIGEFLDGAKAAYEMIVMAFAEGNKKALQNLLSQDVFDGFVKAIDEREQRKERVETVFIGIDKIEIANVEQKDGLAKISLRLKSQLITATRNQQGEVVEGDPAQVTEVIDRWTFAREIGSSNPNWLLVATEAV
ncbi:Tim44/TimA family putative adaptor protein [Polycladidibacter stylochi]|uniref:Tim44/TimA family putative adaptor protein n=1 Tax=Polycladidibacter stylochi TaxID=1807766 RepID=UPI00082D80B6|nr:Tim44/TimA family putative adaptor protein [Pseudovibrio stylochi]